MTNEENNFQLPTNVKQVGSISDGSRIYMEDYACTYIEQYAASEPSKEKIAVLIGKTMTVDNETVIFVSGVLQGKYTMAIRRKTNRAIFQRLRSSWLGIYSARL